MTPHEETLEIFKDYRQQPSPPDVAALMTLAEATVRQSRQLARIADLFERAEERLTDPAFIVGFQRQMSKIYNNLRQSDGQQAAREFEAMTGGGN